VKVSRTYNWNIVASPDGTKRLKVAAPEFIPQVRDVLKKGRNWDGQLEVIWITPTPSMSVPALLLPLRKPMEKIGAEQLPCAVLGSAQHVHVLIRAPASSQVLLVFWNHRSSIEVRCARMFPSSLSTVRGAVRDGTLAESDAKALCAFAPEDSSFRTGECLRTGTLELTRPLCETAFPERPGHLSAAAAREQLLLRVDEMNGIFHFELPLAPPEPPPEIPELELIDGSDAVAEWVNGQPSASVQASPRCPSQGTSPTPGLCHTGSSSSPSVSPTECASAPAAASPGDSD